MRVVWYRPETILQMMATAKLTDTVTGTLGKLKRLDLVVIDDVGILGDRPGYLRGPLPRH